MALRPSTSEYPAAPVAPASSSAVNLLRFIALSTSVHADALQASVDATQAALAQMHSEEAQLSHLDAELQARLEEQRRLHSVCTAIEYSREERRTGEALAREQERRLQEEQERARAGSKRFQSRTNPAASGGYEADVPAPVSEAGALKDRSEAAALQASRIDAEVARLKRLIGETNRMSVRTKLLELEAYKQAARDVDGDALMRELVGGFRFPHEVEQLWGDGGGSPRDAEEEEEGAEVGELTARAPSASYRSLPASQASSVRGGPTSSRSQLPLSRARGRSETAATSAPRAQPVVDHTNIDLLIARATQRLTGRYREILRQLSSAAGDPACTPQEVYKSLLYADYLDGGEGEGNPDAHAVTTLQSLARMTLADRYRRKCEDVSVDVRIADRCLPPSRARQATGENDGAVEPASVLSAHAYCALPTTWPVTAALTDVPAAGLLPPARHVLTQRFSFADAQELKALERLRVRVQRSLLADVLDDARALDDLISAQESFGAPEGAANTREGGKDRFVAEVRSAITRATPPGKPHAWPTIVSTVDDDR